MPAVSTVDPAFSNASTISTLPLRAAHTSAVVPYCGLVFSRYLYKYYVYHLILCNLHTLSPTLTLAP